MLNSQQPLKKCYVVGAGGHCRVIISILQEPNSQYQVQGILDFNQANINEIILGVPIIGSVDELGEKQGKEDIFLAIGDNQKRAECYERLLSLGYKLPNLISHTAQIDSSSRLSLGNVVCPFVFIGPEVTIGDNNILNTRCLIEHETSIGNHCHVAPSALLAGRVQIGEEVFIGLGAKVVDNKKIVSHTIIGAGAVVINDIEKNGVYVGVPARKVGRE